MIQVIGNVSGGPVIEFLSQPFLGQIYGYQNQFKRGGPEIGNYYGDRPQFREGVFLENEIDYCEKIYECRCWLSKQGKPADNYTDEKMLEFIMIPRLCVGGLLSGMMIELIAGHDEHVLTHLLQSWGSEMEVCEHHIYKIKTIDLDQDQNGFFSLVNNCFVNKVSVKIAVCNSISLKREYIKNNSLVIDFEYIPQKVKAWTG